VQSHVGFFGQIGQIGQKGEDPGNNKLPYVRQTFFGAHHVLVPVVHLLINCVICLHRL